MFFGVPGLERAQLEVPDSLVKSEVDFMRPGPGSSPTACELKPTSRRAPTKSGGTPETRVPPSVELGGSLDGRQGWKGARSENIDLGTGSRS